MSALADFLRPRLRLSVPWPPELPVAISASIDERTVQLDWSNEASTPGRFWVEWGDGEREALSAPLQTAAHAYAAPGRPCLRYVTDSTMAALPLAVIR